MQNPSLLEPKNVPERATNRDCCAISPAAKCALSTGQVPDKLLAPDVERIARQAKYHGYQSTDPAQQEACRLILNGCDYLHAAIIREQNTKLAEVRSEMAANGIGAIR